MIKEIFVLAGALYWISFLLRFIHFTRPHHRVHLAASVAEKLAMLAFTAALVFYIHKLEIVNGEVHSLNYDRPVSFLLFAWAISAAHLVTEAAYGNYWSAVFAHFWTAVSLTITSSAATQIKGVFNSDLEWLSFHRLCFLLGYAFCLLGFPLVLRYMRVSRQLRKANGQNTAPLESELWRIDRMGYRMILCALPLLTAGIITELLLLIESHRLPSPEQLWTSRHESLLALTTWFLCGIYLHTRLFFGWRNLRSASLYLAGFVLLIGGHFGQAFLDRKP